MSIWNKVLFVFLFLTSLTFFWLVSQRYLLGKNWETKIAKLDVDLEKTLADNENLFKEIYSDPSVSDVSWASLGLEAQLRRVRELQNGTLWLGCEAVSVGTPNAEGFVDIAFNLPVKYDPQGVLNDGFVYLFDSGEAFVVPETADSANAPADNNAEAVAETTTIPAKFLGAFKVVGATGQAADAAELAPARIQLVSVDPLTENELNELQLSFASHNSLSVSADRLPIDSPADVVVWNGLHPEFLASLSTENADFFACDMVGLEDVENGLSAAKRFPVDFAYLYEESVKTRDYLNVAIARKEAARSDMNAVLVNQYVSLLPKTIDQLSSEEANVVQSIAPKTDVFQTISSLVDPAQLKAAFDKNELALQQADGNNLAAKSYLTNVVETSAENDAMNQYTQLVQNELNVVEQNIKDMKEQIDRLIRENCEIATKIAQAQLFVAESLLKNNDTVSNDSPSFSLNNPI